MRSLTVAAFLVFAPVLALAGAACAQPNQRPEEGMMCLATNGAEEPSVCRRGNAWGDADVCSCRTGTRFSVPVCAAGEKPPAESVALDRYRAQLIRNGGSLQGASFQGRRLCVAVHHPRQY